MCGAFGGLNFSATGYKEPDRRSVCVHQYMGQSWENNADVVESGFSIDGIEGVGCINQQDGFRMESSKIRRMACTAASQPPS